MNNSSAKVHGVHVDKLKTVLIYLKKLRDALDNEVIKKTKFNTLKTKVNNLIHINQCNPDKGHVDKKIPDTSSLATATVLNTNISEVKNKISNSDKYITTPKFNKLTAENVRTRWKQGNLVNKTDFGNKLISFNRSIISNKTKYIKIKKKLNKGK